MNRSEKSGRYNPRPTSSRPFFLCIKINNAHFAQRVGKRIRRNQRARIKGKKRGKDKSYFNVKAHLRTAVAKRRS